MIEILLTKKYPFHTHTPRSEKLLKIVIKELPAELTEEEIKQNLTDTGYNIEKITRMTKKENKPLEMVLIELKREYKSIYSLKKVIGLDVTIESLKNRKPITQCHRCQLYGHVQSNCNAKYKCMNCSENHSTHLCAKPKTTPPKCANCSGEHNAMFKNCPARPTTEKTESNTNRNNP